VWGGKLSGTIFFFSGVSAGNYSDAESLVKMRLERLSESDTVKAVYFYCEARLSRKASSDVYTWDREWSEDREDEEEGKEEKVCAM